MNGSPIDTAVAAVAAVDRAGWGREALGSLTTEVIRLRAAVDALEARIASALASCDEPVVLALTGEGRQSVRHARAVAGRATVCELVSGLHDALAAGELSAAHTDAVARVASRLDDEAKAQLVELAPAVVQAATTSSVEAFETDMRQLERLLSGDEGLSRHQRLVRQRSLQRWVDRQTGLCHTHIELDPEADARLSAALDAAVATEQARDHSETRSWEQLRADAFIALVGGARGRRRHPELAVLVDLQTLREGLRYASVCETFDGQPLPPAVVRRLACEADIIPVVLGGDRVPLDVGRARRVATHQQRVALRAMHSTCAALACTVRYADCDIHHIDPWHPHGQTNLDNLIPLCSRHHHEAHGEHTPEHRARAPAA